MSEENSPPKSRREARRADTYQEIHALAWQQIGEHGSASLSLREISRRMRMSSAAIYRYYPNRAALLSALMVEAFQEINAAMRQAPAALPVEALAERIATACRAYRAWALANPQKYALIYGSPVADYRPDWEMILAPAKEGLEIMLDLVRTAQDSGKVEFSPPEPPLSPAVTTQMEEVLVRRAYGVPPWMLHIVITGWMRLHGLVSLEVFGHIHPLLADMSAMLEQEIVSLLSQIGIRKLEESS